MFCWQCGTNLPEDTAFCSQCGAAMAQAAPPARPGGGPAAIGRRASLPVIGTVVAGIAVGIVLLVLFLAGPLGGGGELGHIGRLGPSPTIELTPSRARTPIPTPTPIPIPATSSLLPDTESRTISLPRGPVEQTLSRSTIKEIAKDLNEDGIPELSVYSVWGLDEPVGWPVAQLDMFAHLDGAWRNVFSKRLDWGVSGEVEVGDFNAAHGAEAVWHVPFMGAACVGSTLYVLGFDGEKATVYFHEGFRSMDCHRFEWTYDHVTMYRSSYENPEMMPMSDAVKELIEKGEWSPFTAHCCPSGEIVTTYVWNEGSRTYEVTNAEPKYYRLATWEELGFPEGPPESWLPNARWTDGVVVAIREE